MHVGTNKFAGDLQRLYTLALTLVTCCLATLVNPYGTGLHQYTFAYLKGTSVLAATDEFLSPVFHGALQPTCLELLFAFFIVGLALSKNRLSMPRLLACLVFSHLALSAVRNLPLFVIVVLPAIAQLSANLKPAASSK